MKKLLFTILLSFVAILAYSQVNYSFRGKANIYSATRGTGIDTSEWNLLAVFQDDMGFYASDSLTLGDYIYTTSDFGCAALRVDTINSKTGGVFNLDVTDMNNVLTSISGQSFVFTPTPNNTLPTFAQGLPAQIQACIIADLALRVDDALSNVTPDSTIFQTVYSGDTSAQAIRQEIADSNLVYPTIGTLLQNKFPFASGTKSLTTSLSYLGRETGRVYVDSLAAFRLPSWLTAGRIASPKNGDGAYNATLHLPDYYINGAWRNGVVSNGALTSTGVPYIDASGHLAYDTGLAFDAALNRLSVNVAPAIPSGVVTIKASGSFSNVLQIRNTTDTYDILLSRSGALDLAASAGDIGFLRMQAPGFGAGNPTSWIFGANARSTTIAAFTGSSGNSPSVNLTGYPSTATVNTDIIVVDGEISPTFGGGSTPATGEVSFLKIKGLVNQTSNSKNITSLSISPTLTLLSGTYTAFDILPTTGIGIRQRSTTPTNRLAGNTRFGADTAPTYTVDITGTLAVSSRTGTGTSIAGFDVNGKIVNIPLSGLSLSSGTLVGAPVGSELIGVCVDTVSQTAHGFVLGDVIYWTGTAYADFVGTTGDTIIPSGIVVESITANSFSYATCGIIDNDFSLPDGLYYATGAGPSLVADTLIIPIFKVEGAKSTVITPVPYSDEVGTVELFTVVTDTGNVVIYGGDSFDLPEAIRSDELGAETSTTPSTAAKFVIHLVDSSGGSKVVTPPSSPVAGDWFAVSNSRGELVNTITIDTSTDKLHSASADHVMVGGVLFARLTYVNSTIGWIISN